MIIFCNTSKIFVFCRCFLPNNGTLFLIDYLSSNLFSTFTSQLSYFNINVLIKLDIVYSLMRKSCLSSGLSLIDRLFGLCTLYNNQ